MTFSKHIVYVDESGDHGPVSAEYPIFALVFCIFDKETYACDVCPAVQRFKFKHLGHDAFVLHEREIRKALPPFNLLQDPTRRKPFMDGLTELIVGADFTLIAAVIRKDLHQAKYKTPTNPYGLAVLFGLERVAMHLAGIGDTGTLHVVCESRGEKEDKELRAAFERIRSKGNKTGRVLDMELVFDGKASNHTGMQIADLIARPVGLHVLRPNQPNRAWDAVEPKFRRGSGNGVIDGFGLKCFP